MVSKTIPRQFEIYDIVEELSDYAGELNVLLKQFNTKKVDVRGHAR